METLSAQEKAYYGGTAGQLPLPGVALIKEFEGCSLTAYPDPLTRKEPYTTGYGCTRKKDGEPWKLGEKITQAEAEELLIFQLEHDYLPALEQIPVWKDMNANQRGAILSFAYNLGAHFYGGENFQTITRVLKNKQWEQIESALLLYVNPRSPVEEGLKRRRKAEAKLFQTPIGSVVPVSFTGLGRQVNLDVCYIPQTTCYPDPARSCNVTSVAMCLYYLGIRGDGTVGNNLPVQMYQRCEINGWSRYTPEGLKALIESYPGCKDDLTLQGSLADIRKALDEGHPCIVHGFFTASGHIIVIRGYNDKDFFVNDPWGEWFPWTYDTNKSGENLSYSKRAIVACCDSFSQPEAMDRYARMNDLDLESVNSIWLHRIYRG